MFRTALLALLVSLSALAQDTKKTCLIAAELRVPWTASMESTELIVSTGKSLTTTGFSRGMTHGGGFVFKDVPLGEFRINSIKYVTPPRSLNNPVIPGIHFDNLGIASAGSNRGDLPNEMSGTCNGGFIWLGSWIGEGSGLTSPPLLKPGSNEISASNARNEVRSQVKGTAWEAEIDKPVANTPLAKGRSPQGQLDAEAAKKAVAAVMNQTRNANAPKSDEGAVEAAAGVYVLTTINNKPLPYLYTANKCTMLDGKIELKADATYTNSGNMECGGNKFALPSAGLFGVVGGALTFAVTKGPPAGAAQNNKLSPEALTVVTATETYVYKKQE